MPQNTLEENDNWEITIQKKIDENYYLVSAPNGDNQIMSSEDLLLFYQNRKKKNNRQRTKN